MVLRNDHFALKLLLHKKGRVLKKSKSENSGKLYGTMYGGVPLIFFQLVDQDLQEATIIPVKCFFSLINHHIT